MDKEVEEKGKIKDNTLLIVLSVFEAIINKLGNVDVYDTKTYSSLKGLLSTFEKDAVYKITVNKANDLTKKLQTYEQNAKNKVEREKKKATDNYWENNKETKNKLDIEKRELMSEKRELENQKRK